jgi:hypothetical protein
MRKYLEARVGIEPTNEGFADLSLTTWVPRPSEALSIFTHHTLLELLESISQKAFPRLELSLLGSAHWTIAGSRPGIPHAR